jgi:DNA-binding transcriptional MerR regulator
MTQPILLSIGAFSNATQLSAKALRLYAEEGILQPARIDKETGYRYYRPEQVREARLVRLLRELDLPLAEITRLLAQRALLEPALKQHMDVLRERQAQQQSAFRAVQELLQPASGTATTAVTRLAVPAMTVATRAFSADGKTLMVRAQTLLAEIKIASSGALDVDAAFIHVQGPLSERDETALELCVPSVQPEAISGDDSSRHFAPQTLACVDVPIRGGVPDWAAASDALFDWFDHHGALLDRMPLILMHGRSWQLAWPIS